MARKNEKLEWKQNGSERLLHTPILDVKSLDETSPEGYRGKYIAFDAPDWTLVIPAVKDPEGDDFVMVRQWRHGLGAVTSEFPGGVGEPGETPEETAARELEEETGIRAGKITLLGSCNPNPALFSNRVNFCLAEELDFGGTLHPDTDEVITCLRVNKQEVLDSFCGGEYQHALAGTALCLYLRHIGRRAD